MWNMFKVNDVVLGSILLILNRFHTHFLVFLLLTLNKKMFARFDTKRRSWYFIAFVV